MYANEGVMCVAEGLRYANEGLVYVNDGLMYANEERGLNGGGANEHGA